MDLIHLTYTQGLRDGRDGAHKRPGVMAGLTGASYPVPGYSDYLRGYQEGLTNRAQHPPYHAAIDGLRSQPRRARPILALATKPVPRWILAALAALTAFAWVRLDFGWDILVQLLTLLLLLALLLFMGIMLFARLSRPYPDEGGSHFPDDD